MKIFILILQVVLALWTIMGALYMMGNYQLLASTWALNTVPGIFWILLGIIQIVLSIGLLISVREGALRKYATPSAVGLAIISLLGAVIYSAYAGFPGILWAVVPALLFSIVAYKQKIPAQTPQFTAGTN